MKRLATAALSALLFLAACGEKEPEAVWPPNDAAIAAMNRGIAELEQFRYLPAAREFQAALAVSPDWTDAKVNLAIAWLNAHGKAAEEGGSKGDYTETLDLLKEVLDADPDEPHANFVVGVILKMGSRAKESLPYFDRVLAVDPDDAATLYWKGSALNDIGDHEGAVEAFRAALKADPYLVAAHWGIRTPLVLTGRIEEASRALENYHRLEPGPEGVPNPGDLLTRKAYTELGRYAMAIRDYTGARNDHAPASVKFERPETPALAAWRYGGEDGPELVPVEPPAEGESARAFVLRVASRIGPGVVLGDFDGDGATDVFLPEWDGPGRLFHNDGGMTFTDVTVASDIATKTHGIGGTFFDADGDGDLDLYVTAAGPNVYYENRGDGTFADRTEAAGLAGGDVVSVSAVPGDFDHEGDIDLFVANYARTEDPGMTGAPDALFQNDRDGTFTDIAPEQGITGGDGRSLGMLAIDVDRDLDTDLLVIRDRQPASLWLNERVWKFRAGELPPSLAGDEAAWGAAAGDIDRDGREEILVFRGPGAGATLYRTDEGRITEAPPGPLANVRARSGVFLDADLDGWLDLVGDDVVVLGEDGKPVAPVAPGPGAVPENARGLGFADLDGDGDLDRIWASHGGAGVVATVAPEENRWIAFDLIGKEQLQPAGWAAPAGPGQELEIRAGRLWQPLRVRAATGFLSSIERFPRFGLGEREKADFLRILWPDRVLQVEAELPANQVRKIVELNRKPDSCPMLFVWDGNDYRFVSDFLGVGGLGFFVAPGVTGSPDPTEYVRIGKWAKPADGKYVVQVMEPLEEISYIDEATLVAVDHPAGWNAYPNERYVGVRELFPEDRIFAVEKEIPPVRATDLEGNDVLPALAAVDRDYVPIQPDRRFPGIAAEHALTLDFTGRVPDVGDDGRLVLFLDGMTEYGYSHTVFAVSQAGIEYRAPRLEVPDGNGGFRTVRENIGFPAGLPKGMTVDVTGVVTPDSPVVRIRTNLEIYWDRAFLGVDRADAAKVTRVKPARADLHHRGYPREYSPDGRLPIIYDYALMDPGIPMKNMSGLYTRFGDVTPLVTETDDRYVIMNHGEEITLEYPADAFPPLPDGWERTLILFSAGWCKDMDPYTANALTVEPLPFRGMSGYPYGEDERYPDDEAHRRYREEWNTRRITR